MEEKRLYGLLPIMAVSHQYQVGKVKFHVASMFQGKTFIEERLADLMIEDLYAKSSEKGTKNK